MKDVIISVTRRAEEHLGWLLANRVEKPGQCLRLVPVPGGAGLVLDRPRKQDKVIAVNGSAVMVVAPLLAPVLKGTILDCEETPHGPQLTLAK